MEAIVIEAKSKAELKVLSDLAKQLGLKSSLLSDEQLEDMGMSLLMKKVNRTKKVSKEHILSKLTK
jgi:hypothetical protein